MEFLRVSDNRHVSVYPMRTLERAWQQAGLVPIGNEQGPFLEFFSKALSKLRLLRRVGGAKSPALVAFMGYSENRLFPLCFAREFIPYCFDCWAPDYDRWESLFRRQKVRLAFFTARQSAEYFSARLPNTVCIWMPEAIDPSEYSAGLPLASRTIDVLELGRKFDRYHEAITSSLSAAGKKHLFEREKGQIIFPGKQEFVEGLAQSKISVCFPCSMTHPERSGAIETLTLRYLESIASRCLIVGRCPGELLELFGYNPVVEFDLARAAEQIMDLLNRIDEYQQLVEANRRRLLEVGTWNHRVAQMLESIAARVEAADVTPSREELVEKKI